MDIKSVVQSKFFRGIVCGVVIFILALLVFRAGVMVGYRKASFSYRFGDAYHRTFGGPGPKQEGLMMFRDQDFRNSGGISGKIVAINLPLLTIDSPNEGEKIVRVASSTIIRRLREDISFRDIVAGEFVVVFGEPNETGEIVARLVRVVPETVSSGAGVDITPKK